MSDLGRSRHLAYGVRLKNHEGQLSANSGRSEELKKATKKPPFDN